MDYNVFIREWIRRAERNEGFDDHTISTVFENCNILKFENFEFEEV